jgi:prepilin-type N-terminal cleavage/methylation domain-containing protein
MRRANKFPIPGTSGGFTLLEMLIVLLIVGTTGAIVIPRLTTISSSFDFALKREAFEQVLDGISYQAFRDSQEIVLAGEYTDHGHTTGTEAAQDNGTVIAGGLRTLSAVDATRELLPPLNPAYPAPPLPAGWRMTVDSPIYFHPTGYCTGGTVALEIGKATYEYTLAPPLCRATLVK